MPALLAQTFFDELTYSFMRIVEELSPVRETLWWGLLWLLPLLGVCGAIYYFLSLPLRRRERARVFLDLVETGLHQGRAPEQAIAASAGSQDPALGIRFHILAEHLRSGLSLDQALDRVPSLLPAGIAATLRIGLRIGDVGRVLPACRKQLKDSVSQTRGALNFVFVMVFMVLPLFPLMTTFLMVWVLPRFQEIYRDMLPDSALPAWCSWQWVSLLAQAQVALTLGLQVLTLCYVAGPRLRNWLGARGQRLADRLNWRLPWRRHRLERDFSTMLALLLDAGTPEGEALSLAGASTASSVMEGRAAEAGARLAAGNPLTEAVKALDDSGEIEWRLANAARSGQGFMKALQGWIEALDARAFQQEQAAAQLFTTGLVLFNGFLVAVLAINVFLILTTLITEGTLW